jgi:transposase InsO family protein
MRFEFIHVEKAVYPVTVLCHVLDVSRSGYYGWTKRGPSARQEREDELARKVETVHRESRDTYGSPRVCAKLRQKGEVVSPKTVAKIMRKKGIAARRRKKFRATTDSRNTKRIAPNVLNRDFTAERPDQAWVTDVTALWTLGGWCFLAAILDLFSRRVVGWAISESNDTTLALSALQRALDHRRPAPGLLHHSDRGSPYGSDDYVAALKRHGIKRSMSRKGDCWDNAVAESFFASLEHECVRDQAFVSPGAATRTVESYIDNFYNPERLHSTLGYYSPIEFELRSALHQEAA